MAVVLPTSLMAQDSARAMLHNDGGTWVKWKFRAQILSDFHAPPGTDSEGK
jgi:hypothetical protein